MRYPFSFRVRSTRLVVPLGWNLIAGIVITITGYTLLNERGSEIDQNLAAGIGVSLWLLLVLAHVVAFSVGTLIRSFTGDSEIRTWELSPTGVYETGYQPQSTFRAVIASSIGVISTYLALGATLFMTGYLAESASSIVDNALESAGLLLGATGIIHTLPAFPLAMGSLYQSLFGWLDNDWMTGTHKVFVMSYLIAIVGAGYAFGVVILRPEWSIISVALVLLGLFCTRIAWSEVKRVNTIQRASLYEAGRAIEGTNARLPASQSLDQAIDTILGGLQNGPALVIDQNVVVGILSVDQIRRIGRKQWPTVSAAEVSVPIDQIHSMPGSMSLLELFRWQQCNPGELLLIEHNERILGAIDRRVSAERLLRRVEEAARA